MEWLIAFIVFVLVVAYQEREQNKEINKMMNDDIPNNGMPASDDEWEEFENDIKFYFPNETKNQKV